MSKLWKDVLKVVVIVIETEILFEGLRSFGKKAFHKINEICEEEKQKLDLEKDYADDQNVEDPETANSSDIEQASGEKEISPKAGEDPEGEIPIPAQASGL